MAWTTPRTWATNELVTAALMNQHVRDNMNYLLTPNTFFAQVSTPNYTTTSTTSVLVNASVQKTITMNGGHLLVSTSGVVYTTASTYVLAIDIDGSIVANVMHSNNTFADQRGVFSNTLLVTGLSVGSHTVSLKWLSNGGNTLTMYNSWLPLTFCGVEI